MAASRSSRRAHRFREEISASIARGALSPWLSLYKTFLNLICCELAAAIDQFCHFVVTPQTEREGEIVFLPAPEAQRVVMRKYLSESFMITRRYFPLR
jgi:hypothetical protein